MIQKIRKGGLLILLLLVVCSCGTGAADKKTTLNGTWESIGSGWILQIRDSSTYTFYDYTSISCIPTREGPLSEIRSDIHLNEDTLFLKKGVITYKYVRKDSLHPLCRIKRAKEINQNPLFNFDVFAETVKDHFAFFDRNGINWDSLRQIQRERVSDENTAANLYRVLEETLATLKDNHAYLEAPAEVSTVLELPAENEPTVEDESFSEYGDFEVANLVSSHHLKKEMTKDSWLIQWGMLNDSIGYMQVKAMWLFADLDIETALIDSLGYVDAYVQSSDEFYEGIYIKKEVEGVSSILDRALADFKDTASLVLDIRFNGGGQDAVAFEILSRFTRDSLQVATQKLKHGDRYTETQALYIKGVNQPYQKPVFVLTSPQTGSAAEALAIATLPMENIYRIGAPTSGAMSTALEKTLPNGWVFSLSNEVYMDNDGVCYEYEGIPVDYSLTYSRDRQELFRQVINNLEADKAAIVQAVGAIQKEDYALLVQ